MARTPLKIVGGLSVIVGAFFIQKAVLGGKFGVFDPFLAKSANIDEKKIASM